MKKSMFGINNQFGFAWEPENFADDIILNGFRYNPKIKLLGSLYHLIVL